MAIVFARVAFGSSDALPFTRLVPGCDSANLHAIAEGCRYFLCVCGRAGGTPHLPDRWAWCNRHPARRQRHWQNDLGENDRGPLAAAQWLDPADGAQLAGSPSHAFVQYPWIAKISLYHNSKSAIDGRGIPRVSTSRWRGRRAKERRRMD